MVKFSSKFSLIFAVSLIILVVMTLISACDIGRQQTSSRAVGVGILAPAQNVEVVVGNPVQIQTAFENPDDISRVELWVGQADQPETAKLLRSDIMTEPTITQQWIPESPADYMVRVRAYDVNNTLIDERARQFTAIDLGIGGGTASIGVAFRAGPGGAETTAAALAVPYRYDYPLLNQLGSGCPVINRIEISGAQESGITPGTSLNVSVELGQPIQMNWLLDNFTPGGVATVAVAEVPPGEAAPAAQTFSGSDTFIYTPNTAGQYRFILAVKNDVCPDPVQREITVNVQEKPTTPTPIVLVLTVTPEPSPTPTRFFPPPPPLPGVPAGPTQAEIPAMGPPVCDAAEYLGVYAGEGDLTQRIYIPTDDEIPARVTAGTTVHRAWRLRNIGTCTWGPGYELAFYGGRAMGSGGVPFEFFFPSQPVQRNRVVDQNRLIAPEGKPNQTAIAEVLINTPSIPGIHQSYWRMRNPQGVYFGPIVGITLDVVRECEPKEGEPKIYGAPVVSFRILGTNGALAPEGAGETLDYYVEAGQLVTLDWNVVNATNFDIVIQDPTGNIQTISTPESIGRTNFTPTRVGWYTLTMFVENGVCAYRKTLRVFVTPPEDQQFILNIVLSSASASATASAAQSHVESSSTVNAGDVVAKWQHFDPNANQFILLARRERRTLTPQCLVSGWAWTCRDVWGEWSSDSEEFSTEVGTASTGQAQITNLDSNLCQASTSTVQYRVQYVMEAKMDGKPAKPEFSNQVYVSCGSGTSTPLPTEIQQ